MKNRKKIRIFRITAGSLFAVVFVLGFSGIAAPLAQLLKLQAAPVLLRCVAAFSIGAAASAVMILLSAFLFGRFYCACFCPLGLLQDFSAFVFRRRGKSEKDHYILRYAVSAAVFGMLSAGSVRGFLALDPYSNAGRILFPFTAGGVAALVSIVLLAVWKRRIFCTALCPVGTLLGLLSRYGVFRIQISSGCVSCGKCVSSCPAGCIDLAAKSVDNERCIRCMNCISVCPVGSISLCRSEKAGAFSDSRRRFLISGAVLAAGFAAGAAFAGRGIVKLKEKLKILPPGAGNSERFSRKCTACMLCAANCPQKIIVPSRCGVVELDLSRGACDHNCSRCSNICPTGALQRLPLAEKRRLKIAEAKFDPRRCIVFQEGEKCGRCAAVCPTGAVTLRKNGTPRPVKKSLCIGCGACQKVCPASPKAMNVFAIENQKKLSEEGDFR